MDRQDTSALSRHIRGSETTLERDGCETEKDSAAPHSVEESKGSGVLEVGLSRWFSAPLECLLLTPFYSILGDFLPLDVGTKLRSVTDKLDYGQV